MAFPLPKKSSKRKREDSDSPHSSSPNPPPSHRQPLFNPQESHLLGQEEFGRNSPRSTVAGYLGHLDIYEDGSRLDSKHRAVTTKDGKLPVRAQVCAIPPSGFDDLPANANANGSSPLPTPQKKGKRASTTPKSSPRGKQQQQHSPTPHEPQNPRHRSKSPPLSSDSDINDLTWSDAEITGHLGEDPDDDGYGINGLGFKPTPAMARSRSERRKKQIAEWKTREAREARQSRRERRDGVGGDSPGKGNPSLKKVKFQA
ncbi:hypothetical protein FQN54_009368 [Arachnomyces sp. PD_36]|nr:hypothetical protein FQN54_009368 [Arachnomyces sp. PD_36]